MTHLHKPTPTQPNATVSASSAPISSSIFFAEGGGDSKVKVSLPKMNLKAGIVQLDSADPVLVPGWEFQVKSPPMSYPSDATVLGWLPTIPGTPDGTFTSHLVSTREMRSVAPLPVSVVLSVRWEDYTDAADNAEEPKIKRFTIGFHASLTKVKQDPSGNVHFHLTALEHPESVKGVSGDLPDLVYESQTGHPRLTTVLALASISLSCDFEVFAVTESGSAA